MDRNSITYLINNKTTVKWLFQLIVIVIIDIEADHESSINYALIIKLLDRCGHIDFV